MTQSYLEQGFHIYQNFDAWLVSITTQYLHIQKVRSLIYICIEPSIHMEDLGEALTSDSNQLLWIVGGTLAIMSGLQLL